jgi:acyl-coenzyme A synthetase/AMP-(fatty) acid ligase
MANLYNRLHACFPADRTRPFATLGDGSVMTYADLEQSSARYANLLVSMGVAQGDRVAVQTPKSIDMVMLYLACLRAGAIFLLHARCAARAVRMRSGAGGHDQALGKSGRRGAPGNTWCLR